MGLADLVLGLFAACNIVRLAAYVPQIVAILRDEAGATAVSCLSWLLFAISNAATVAYALVHAGDHAMALLFGLNTLCCAAIIVLTLMKRIQARRHAPPIRLAPRRIGFDS